MKKLISMVALSAALLCPLTSALAADQNDGGFFIRGNAGQSDYRVGSQYFSSNTDFGWGLGAGYRWATSSGNWGIDAGYVDLGKAKLDNSYMFNHYGAGISTQGKAAAHGWSMGGNYLYQFNDNWNLQARTGVVFTKARVDADVMGPLGNTLLSSRQSSSNTSWYWGAGVGYDFTHNFGMSLAYDYYRVGYDGGHGHASLLSVGAEYRF